MVGRSSLLTVTKMAQVKAANKSITELSANATL